MLCENAEMCGDEKMADEDSITQRYVSDEAVFADICNFMVYDGEQKIKSEDLQGDLFFTRH